MKRIRPQPKARKQRVKLQLEDYGSSIEHAYARHLFESRAEDAMIVRFVVAVIVSQWLAENQELTWGYIVGPPSSGKTEVVIPLLDWHRVHACDEATENALVSASDPDGKRAKARADGEDDSRLDPSMLKDLDGKILICKDLTPMASKPSRMDAFLGNLRTAFDGRSDKDAGTVGHQSYKARFGLIACMTPGLIDLTMNRLQSLGERALVMRTSQYALKEDESCKAQTLSMNSRVNKHRRRQELTAAVPDLLDLCIDQASKHGATTTHAHAPEIVKHVMLCAHYLTKIRSVPVESSAQWHERPYRVSQQMIGLADASALSYGRGAWGEPEKQLISRVTRDSLPIQTLRLFQCIGVRSRLPNPSHHWSAVQCCEAIGLTDAVAAMAQCRNWELNGLVRIDPAERVSMLPDVLKSCTAIGIVPPPTA